MLPMHKVTSEFEDAIEVGGLCVGAGKRCYPTSEALRRTQVFPAGLWTRPPVVVANHSKSCLNGNYVPQEFVDTFR